MRAHLLSGVALASLVLSAVTYAQPTAFTYQGRLKNGAALAGGPHDFRFTLFDVASGGVQLAPPVCADNVAVAEGLFTTALDFGQQFVTASPLFLQIEVRADTGLTCGNPAGLILLGPRQILSAAPIASHARTAFALAAADGSPATAVSVDSAGNVGIGTLAPTHLVHIASAAPTLAIQDTDSTTQQVGYVSYRDSGNVERAWVGYGSAGDPDFSIINVRPAGDIVLNTFGGGRIGIGTPSPVNLLSVAGSADVSGSVGIGTSAPAAKLDVRGSVRLGTSGEFLAPGGHENLRLVRGTIDGNGTVISGTGFTAQRNGEGSYAITFQPAFFATPSVTVTVICPPGGNGRTAQVFLPSASSVLIGTRFFEGSTNNTDSDLMFCAIGPR